MKCFAMNFSGGYSAPVLFLVLTLSNGLSAQSPNKKTFEIIVSIEHLKTPAKLILTMREAGQWVEYSTESKAGQFMLSGTIKDCVWL